MGMVGSSLSKVINCGLPSTQIPAAEFEVPKSIPSVADIKRPSSQGRVFNPNGHQRQTPSHRPAYWLASTP
ncbi:hypothetical protein GCM10007927_31920 [Sulfitobacter pacificus]|uniref:Uncharacterized protein n=1 Tax=Sulfitobacter pacificus TaxID=1499314 RepID=A0ABQ5VN71_9RHOB|nr:hypothetical protein GCM10007927_31920 [Sulfitobacter pacificus]